MPRHTITDVCQRATTTGLVLSGFGLSAFWFSLLANTLFPGDISAFLLILAIGTATPMLIGLLIVKPVPLPPTGPDSQDGCSIDGYDPIQNGDDIVFIGEPQAALGSEMDTASDVDSAPLLPHDQGPGSYQVSSSPSVMELNPPVGLYHERNVGNKDVLPDIHGKRLWLAPDFYLVFVIMAICG